MDAVMTNGGDSTMLSWRGLKQCYREKVLNLFQVMEHVESLKNTMDFLPEEENAHAHRILLSVQGNYRTLNPSMNHYCKEEWKYV